MDIDEYNKFLAAACDIVGATVNDGAEFVDGTDGIRLDDESRLMLCISSPDRLDAVDEILSNFNKYAGCVKKEKTA